MPIEALHILNHSKLIFSIPIYYRTREKSFEAYKIAEAKHIEEIKSSWEEQGFQYPEDIKLRHIVSFNKKWPNWRYNEIISYIEIRLFENEFYSYLFTANNEKYNARIPNKKFIWKENSYFSSFPIVNQTSTDILNWILSLQSEIISRSKKYRNYYFDFSTVENIADAIDFAKLVT